MRHLSAAHKTLEVYLHTHICFCMWQKTFPWWFCCLYYSFRCCLLSATEELWEASGVGDGEGPPLVNPSAQEARCAGKSCHGPAYCLCCSWTCITNCMSLALKMLLMPWSTPHLKKLDVPVWPTSTALTVFDMQRALLMPCESCPCQR